MAENETTIDLTTLQEVHRLLATTEFASIDDLARRGLSGFADAGTEMSSAASGSTDGQTPLPRRR